MLWLQTIAYDVTAILSVLWVGTAGETVSEYDRFFPFGCIYRNSAMSLYAVMCLPDRCSSYCQWTVPRNPSDRSLFVPELYHT